MLVILILTLCVVVVCYELLHDRKSKEWAKKIPGPRGFPIIGNGHMFIGPSSKFRNTVEYLFREYGDRSRMFIGHELFVFISNPGDIEALTTSMDYIDKSRDYDSLKPWLGLGLLTATGSKWKLHRKFLTPTFHFTILREFVPVFEKNARILAETLSEKALTGEQFNIYQNVSLCALDGICETAMGVAIDAQRNANSEYVKAVTDVSSLTNYRMRHFLLRNDIFFNISRTKVLQTRALKIVHEFRENVIRNRRKQLKYESSLTEIDNDIGMKKRVTFLDLLLLSEVDGSKLSDQSVGDEVDTFMFEGHDTTTSAISFTLHLISKHPEVQQRLYEEQQAIFTDDFNRDAVYNDLMEMKYMEQVIKESLRLFPSVPLIGRKIPQDSNINGLKLPAGTTVLIDVLHLQRNPKLYEDPLAFKPERFDIDNINRRSPFSWVAFSAGPRNCIGQKFAMLEMKSTLSRLIRTYEFRDVGVEPDLSLDLILKPVNGIQVTAKNRSASNVRLTRNY